VTSRKGRSVHAASHTGTPLTLRVADPSSQRESHQWACVDELLILLTALAVCPVALQHLHELVTPRTKLISLVHVSNMLGAVLDVEAVVEAARKVGARVLLDSCQSMPHMPLDVQALGVDWIVASAHKAVGPTGIGFLWGR